MQVNTFGHLTFTGLINNVENKRSIRPITYLTHLSNCTLLTVTHTLAEIILNTENLDATYEDAWRSWVSKRLL